MGLPTGVQLQRHHQFIQQHIAELGAIAMAGYAVDGPGAVIVNEADQTLRYQGGGRRAFRGKRWRREASWIARYDPEQLMIIINTFEVDHASYFMGLPVTTQEVMQALQVATLGADSRALIERLLGQPGQ
jgi:hypothetical protein